MNKAYLSLGSNIGDRLDFIGEAQERLEMHPKIQVIKYSPLYETENWPKKKNDKKENWHLNQVVKIETELKPSELLSELQKIEKQISQKKREHWAPREIDIDLLLYADEIMNTENLKIPHPYIKARQFILIPLLDLSPNLEDPVSKKHYSDILDELKQKDDHRVIRFL